MSLTVANSSRTEVVQQSGVQAQQTNNQTDGAIIQGGNNDTTNNTTGKTYQAPDDPQQLKDNILELLSKNGIKVPNDKFIENIIAKHNDIINKNQTIDENVLNARLVNYARGLQIKRTETVFSDLYQNGVTTSSEQIEVEGVKEAIESFDGKTEASFNQAMEKQNAAFHQAAAARIELYDSNGDGKVSVQELITQSVKDEEERLGRTLTSEEKEIVKNSAINRMAMLDQTNDNVIDNNEMAAFVWASAKVNDTETHKSAGDITYEEWVTAQETMSLLDFDNLSQEEIDKVAKFNQTLKNGYEGLKK